MDQVSMYDIGPEAADLPHQGRYQRQVQITACNACRHVDTGLAEPIDETMAVLTLEYAHRRFDAAFGERWQQREEMPLGSSDALCSLNVQNPHSLQQRVASA
jgi:hypothetical protein